MSEDYQAEILQYEIERETEFGSYVARIAVDMATGKGRMYLYKEQPKVKGFLKFIVSSNEPIKDAPVSPTTDVHYLLTKLITTYEIPLYQKMHAEEQETYLPINYEEEIRKRRVRLMQGEEEQQQVSHNANTVTISDWTEKKREMHPNSLENLKKNQGKRYLG
jgi:hypothetical protein